jgi:hypothetical protein
VRSQMELGAKSKPFVCSNLKSVSKSRQEEYTIHSASLSVIGSLITCCKRNKLNCQVIMSYRRWNSSKSMHIVNGIILILMLLMIAMFSVNRFNRP